jgi:phi13 family phage major tail protein
MAGVQVGLNSLYYAVLTSDTPLAATYNSPVAIAGAINAKISPKSNTETLYCDDGPDETVTSLGEIDVEFETKDIDLNTQAESKLVNSNNVIYLSKPSGAFNW